MGTFNKKNRPIKEKTRLRPMSHVSSSLIGKESAQTAVAADFKSTRHSLQVKVSHESSHPGWSARRRGGDDYRSNVYY